MASAMPIVEVTPPVPSSSSFHTHTSCKKAYPRILRRQQSPNCESQETIVKTSFREKRLKEGMDCNTRAAAVAVLLQSCTDTIALNQVHGHMVATGLDHNIFLFNKLVNMYAMCGDMDTARLLFDQACNPTIFLWNVMIRGYATNGDWKAALAFYRQVQWGGEQPDKFTFPFALKACAGLHALKEGKAIHNHIVRAGFEFDIYVGNSLVSMYAKCGSSDLARHVFDKMSERDVVSWSAMISGYAQDGKANEALTLLRQVQLAEVTPSAVIMASLLQACGHLAALQQGKSIQGYLVRNGFESDVVVGTALIDMYAKCGSMEKARQLFDKMSTRNEVSWTAMITGYAHNGLHNEALTLFHQMQLSGEKPDPVTMVSLLPACANLASLYHCKWIHCYIIRSGLKVNVRMGNALLVMYAKCGSIEIARQVFDKMSERDVVSWNAMITGYGLHGHGEDALELFSKMQQIGVKPDDITFVGVLSACSHAGLVDEGCRYFDCMTQDYRITPTLEHYACMVDLLGRAGRLDEAYDFIRRMPLEPDVTVWGALLGACRIHRDIELGECVAKHIFDMDPGHAGCYVLLSNIYAAAGRWDNVSKVRSIMRDRRVKKTPGCSLIEVSNRVHSFLVGDQSHPQSANIYATLEILTEQIKDAGYVPHTNFVLHDVEDEVKEHMLCRHSEKLAIAFGIISTSPGTPIRITKNLRVCGDCHHATKFISKIVKREIIVRDANRFHHFKDGLCSCMDYW